MCGFLLVLLEVISGFDRSGAGIPMRAYSVEHAWEGLLYSLNNHFLAGQGARVF